MSLERPTYEPPSPYGSTEPAATPVTGTPPGAPGLTNGWAIASLVLGILGVVGFPPLIPSILALIFGYKGKREIDRSDGVQQGRGLAVAGIIALITFDVIGVPAGSLAPNETVVPRFADYAAGEDTAGRGKPPPDTGTDTEGSA